MVFTPLVSPAVTPLDTDFSVPEYTIPGAYFSPLTSPALEAQSRSSHGRVSRSSVATPPVDMMIDSCHVSTNLNIQGNRKTTAKRRNSTNRNLSRVVRQSPSMKPTKRKVPPGSLISNASLVEAIDEPLHSARSNSGSRKGGSDRRKTSSRGSSEAESISPEPLSEALMPPPRRPGSGGTSPALVPRTSHPSQSSQDPRSYDNRDTSRKVAPATPASLMRLPTHSEFPPRSTPSSQSIIEDNPATGPLRRDDGPNDGERHKLPRLETGLSDEQATPTLSATKTPSLRPASSPAGTLPVSGSSTSQSPNFPPSTPGGSSATGKGDGRSTGRGGRKRASASSQASPAIHPKISPSIKPLLPEHGKHESSLYPLFSLS